MRLQGTLRLGLLSGFLLLGLSLPVQGSEILTPPEDRRTGDQTFLTFPEWFLVHSPTEYASYVKTNPPTDFPFFGHIRQLWSSYAAMYSEVKTRYPFNGEYHTMIMVIGVSTTAEYGLRTAWETLMGRLSEWSAAGELTPEDRFGSQVADDYARFILTTPWYEFDYWGALTGLWSEVPLAGDNLFRRLERRYLLTSEYLIKAGYAALIGMGAQASFDAPVQTTISIIDSPVEGVTKSEPMAGEAELWMAVLPRYQPFTEQANELAGQGVRFAEIAGNRGDILVSVLAPTSWPSTIDHSRLLFSQPLLTQPGIYRRAIAVPVAELHNLLIAVDDGPAQLEHVYDF